MGHWHESRVWAGVLIAVPNCQGRVSPVFDVAARLLVVHVKGGTEQERWEIVLFEKQPDGIVRSLVEMRINVLICGAISQGLCLLLAKAGIRVVSHICGEIDAVMAAYGAGDLQKPEFRMPGCCGRHWDGLMGAGPCRKAARIRRRRPTQV
jgi:predicted Fe-Mo cluster-binding NifX family protein